MNKNSLKGGVREKSGNHIFFVSRLAPFFPLLSLSHSLVPINFSRNNKLAASPAFLLNNSAQLHLCSLAGERLTDIEQVDPVLES